jgi:hypothetical protein
VKLYENNVLKDTLTVTSGSFSKSITQNSEGTYSYYVVFEGSSTYDSITSSTGSIVVSDVPTPTPASVSLTSDKSILSYADSESATLSATVLDSGSNPLEGVTVEFFKGSTSLGTADTNSSGVATKSYASAGSGDVSFTAEADSIISSETYVEDCIKVGFNNWNGTFTTGTDTYDYITPTGTDVSPNVTLPSSFKVNYKFKNTNTSGSQSNGSGLWNIGADTNNGILIGHETSDKRIRAYIRTNGSNSAQTPVNNVYEYNTWTDAEIVYQNGTISLTVVGQTISYSISALNIMQFYASYTALRIAEWKIKPL